MVLVGFDCRGSCDGRISVWGSEPVSTVVRLKIVIPNLTSLLYQQCDFPFGFQRPLTKEPKLPCFEDKRRLSPQNDFTTTLTDDEQLYCNMFRITKMYVVCQTCLFPLTRIDIPAACSIHLDYLRPSFTYTRIKAGPVLGGMYTDFAFLTLDMQSTSEILDKEKGSFDVEFSSTSTETSGIDPIAEKKLLRKLDSILLPIGGLICECASN